jgi:hypothetical protein
MGTADARGASREPWEQNAQGAFPAEPGPVPIVSQRAVGDIYRGVRSAISGSTRLNPGIDEIQDRDGELRRRRPAKRLAAVKPSRRHPHPLARSFLTTRLDGVEAMIGSGPRGSPRPSAQGIGSIAEIPGRNPRSSLAISPRKRYM